jgi:hypothetical protein
MLVCIVLFFNMLLKFALVFRTVNDYGTLSKKNGNLDENIINSFYTNRPYKQNEFDEVCKHQPVRKPGKPVKK